VGASELLPQVEAEAILADKAYDADERVRIPLTERGIEVVIPSKNNRKHPYDYDRVLYQARHLVENFLALHSCGVLSANSHRKFSYDLS
jgi:hypothetical protein